MVERLKAEHRVDVEWRPFYLRPDTPPEGMDLPEYIQRARLTGSEERLRAIAKAYGMEFKSTEPIYNTRLAHEATEYAREHGRGNEFHKVVFRKVYAEGSDPSQWAVLRSAAEEVGLDVDEMQREVEAEKYTAAVVDRVRWAYQIGVTGVPTYVINNRFEFLNDLVLPSIQKSIQGFTSLIWKLYSNARDQKNLSTSFYRCSLNTHRI